MLTISNSEINTWQRCRRKWYLSYYLAATPADPEVTGVRILGTRVHAALEGYYGYQLDPVAVLSVLYRAAAEKYPDHEADLAKEHDLASAMVEGYLPWLEETGEDAGLEVVATEKDVQVELPGAPGVILRARLDQQVYNSATGLLMFLDHKSAADFEAHEDMALDPQFKIYSLIQLLAAGPDGPQAYGGIRNTLRRVKRTSRSKPPYYQRDEFHYNPDDLRSTLRRVSAVVTEIQAARELLDETYEVWNADLDVINQLQQSVLPPTPIPRDCKWSCPFKTLCPMMDDGSDWPGVITRSGRFGQSDPYAYYSEDPLRDLRDGL